MASPLLISANVRNMSAANMETYKNERVIAVNQDPLGKQGVRLVGGKLSGRSSDGNQRPSLVTCNHADKSQSWIAGPNSTKHPCPDGMQTYQNAGDMKLFNSDDCGSNLILYPWTESGCDGNKGFCFSITDGAWKSAEPKAGSCVQISGKVSTLEILHELHV